MIISLEFLCIFLYGWEEGWTVGLKGQRDQFAETHLSAPVLFTHHLRSERQPSEELSCSHNTTALHVVEESTEGGLWWFVHNEEQHSLSYSSSAWLIISNTLKLLLSLLLHRSLWDSHGNDNLTCLFFGLTQFSQKCNTKFLPVDDIFRLISHEIWSGRVCTCLFAWPAAHSLPQSVLEQFQINPKLFLHLANFDSKYFFYNQYILFW